jgi:predicted nuclease of restriction endonuclease-like (RecB) superfamily
MKLMRQFFEEWNFLIQPSEKGTFPNFSNSVATASDLEEIEFRPPLAVDLTDSETVQTKLLLPEIRQPSATELSFEEFISISFTHHMEIIHKTHEIPERIFYIHQTFINQWDKYALRNILKADLYHHQGELANNFAKTIPNKKNALKAIAMFKDEYLLNFINVEELGERDKADVDESVVEQEIIHNVKKFIMTFGHDFAFVGNQYHLEIFGHDQYPDLLFYNRELAALVAVELKQGEFKPAYLGQLSAYLRILDDKVKKPFENPSIGIILCKQADKNFVEYLIQGYENPMGVATYKTAEDVRKVLPTEEELAKAMDNG